MAERKLFRSKFVDLFKSWEFFLLILLILIFVINSNISPNFFKLRNLFNSTQIFMELAILALPITFIILTGFIDISIGSNIALSAVVMSVIFRSGVNIWLAVVCGVLTGLLAGLFNGIIITKLKIPSIVVTLTTLIFFRGIALAILKDQVVVGFPEKFGILGGTYKELLIPVQLIVYIIFVVIFGLILHKTMFGRFLYAIGNNESACRYSGINVDRIRLLLFALSGLMSGFVGMILASRLGSVRPDIAQIYELKVVTIVVLGGVAIFGGKGSILGVFLSTLVIGYINYGLRLINVKDQIISIIIGAILIIALLAPRIINIITEKRRSILYLEK